MKQPELFFAIEEGVDPLDKYEELLFEDKKFFNNKPILALVFRSRLDKMRLRQEAFEALFPDLVSEVNIQKEATVEVFPSDLYAAFDQYFKRKGQLMLHIFGTETIPELTKLAEALISLQQQFNQAVFLPEVQLEPDVILSATSDPSELVRALKSFKESGGKSTEEAFQMDYPGKELLVKELKRLFLQHQKEKINEGI